MLFRRISYRIALQFTAFVFLLFMINGVVFLAADLENAHRQTNERLLRTSQQVLDRARIQQSFILPSHLRERVRVVDVDGDLVYGGALLLEIPFSDEPGVTQHVIQGEQYTVMTASILENGRLAGYVQVAEPERLQLGDVPRRALLYLIVSCGVSALTFGVGIFFARRSLKPAEQMMGRLEQFTQDASHELRTPLAALSSSLDLALHKKEYESGIVSAKEDLQQITVLIERLLELARLDQFAVELKTVDLSQLLRQSIETYRPLAAEKHIEIRDDIAENVTVFGDETLLRRVIGNLLANAMKFNAPKGHVRIRLTRHALTIHDTGIGIAKADLPRIFDRFYRADASRTQEGFGLGLALVKRIVDLHDWKITVASELGKGTTFTVHFGKA